MDGGVGGDMPRWEWEGEKAKAILQERNLQRSCIRKAWLVELFGIPTARGASGCSQKTQQALEEDKTNTMGHTRLLHRFESKPRGINFKRYRKKRKYTHRCWHPTAPHADEFHVGAGTAVTGVAF